MIQIAKRKTIGPEHDPYMIRYIVASCKYVGIMVHKFLRSDYERALHDHPWPFISIILWRGYAEVTPSGTKLKYPGMILFRPATWKHRVILDKPVWTLVIKGTRVRRWGFWGDTGWCWWRKYNPENAICEDSILWEGGED